MGEVYRARDTKLGREVALKILPAAFAADPDRLMRFEREARTLAALNHPHIAQVYGVEDGSDATGVVTRALVLELVEGDDLSQRIARGPIPLDEALAIARQIADALEAAHEQGIIHRDLKPANIKVRDDGTVKVLDFGLAKAMETGVGSREPGVGSALANSPTITSPALTQAGIILGTAAYMAPEQAKGRPATRRSDIWAFGCVLYEMLTGRRAFDGEDISDTLAAVLRGEPDWSRLPGASSSIRRLLRRCLARDPKARLADIADARLELDVAEDAPLSARSMEPRRSGAAWLERSVWALVAIAAITAAFVARSAPRAAAPPEMRVDIVTPAGEAAPDPSIALSPDGRSIAFIADDGRLPALWVRALDSGTARPIARTEGAQSPFWSSDSRAVGFFTSSQLKTVDIATGSVQTVATVLGGGGGAWFGSTILFSPNSGAGPLFRVDAGGGQPTPVSALTSDAARVHRHPAFLPDGRHFLYFEAGASGGRVFVGSLEGASPNLLVAADSGAVYSASGHLFFMRQGALVAQPFDANSRTLTGTAQLLLEQVAVNTIGQPAVSVSLAGTIAYRTGARAQRQYVWHDRAGKEIARVATPEVATQNNPELSPDGARLAVQRSVDGNADVWLLDLKRGMFQRLTDDPAIDAFPVWSPDGQRLVFTSNRARPEAPRPAASPSGLQPGLGSLFLVSADGSSEPRVLVESAEPKWASYWSRDGKRLLFRSLDSRSGKHDVWVTTIENPSPVRVLGSAADERDAQLSPDERWIAFQSDESGRDEIYVQRFPGPGGKERISTGGGTQVRWRADGLELFYVTPDNALAAVSIQLPSGEGSPRVDAPNVLFPTRMYSGGVGIPKQQYVVSQDGQRFLVNVSTPVGELARPITLLLNWKGLTRE
jgi:Tol biopolymer transport system component